MTQAPCVGLTCSYTSIYILNFSTIDLGGDVQTGLLDLEGGEIRNTANGQNITVTGELNWTLGAINASTYSGALNIDGSAALDGFAGATALFAPVGGGSVSLGSNVNLVNGAVGTMREGTINVSNGADLNVNAVLNADPGVDKVITFLVAGGGSQINVTTGGSLTFKSGSLTSYLPLKNDGGTVTIRPDTFAHFHGAVAGYPGGQSYVQTAGTTRLYMGNTTVNARMNAEEGMLMADGTLDIETRDQGAVLNGAATIVLGSLNNKTLMITGGQIIYRDGDAAYYDYGELLVVGNVNWQGGTYRPYVKDDTADWADLWRISGALSIGGTAAVDAKAVDGEGNVVDPQPNKSWLFLSTGLGITPAVGTPTLGAGWGFATSNENTPLKWFLRAV